MPVPLRVPLRVPVRICDRDRGHSPCSYEQLVVQRQLRQHLIQRGRKRPCPYTCADAKGAPDDPVRLALNRIAIDVDEPADSMQSSATSCSAS